MHIGRFRNKRKALTVDFEDGDKLNLVYDPNYLTPETEDELSSATKSDDLAAFLAGMVVEWDLTEDELDGDGNPTGAQVPFPPEHARLRLLPVTVLGEITRAIAEDAAQETRAEGKASDDTSPQTASLAPSQTGTS